MTVQHFHIGQTVYLRHPASSHNAAAGVYEIEQCCRNKMVAANIESKV